MLRGSQSGAPTGRDALRRIRVSAGFGTLAVEERVDGAGNGVDDLVLIHIAEGIGVIICDARRKLRGRVRRPVPSLTAVVFAEPGHEAIRHGAIAKVVKSPATLFTEAAG